MPALLFFLLTPVWAEKLWNSSDAASVRSNSANWIHTQYSLTRFSDFSCEVQQPYSEMCELLRGFQNIDADLSFLNPRKKNPCSNYLKNNFSSHDFCGKQNSDIADTPNEHIAKGFEYLNDQDKPNLVQKVRIISGQVATKCCGKDTGCKNAIQNIKVSFCQLEGPNEKSDCTVFKGHYRWPMDLYLSVNKRQNATSDSLVSTNALPVAGELVFSPFKNKKNIDLEFETRLIIHELMHTCVDIRNQLRMSSKKKEDREAAVAYIKASLDGVCTETSVYPFEQLYPAFGISPNMAECMKKVVKGMKEGEHGLNACKDICPRAVLAEGFSKAVAIFHNQISVARTSSYVPSLWPIGVCEGRRDNWHPSDMDVFECLLQTTPEFRSKLANDINCTI